MSRLDAIEARIKALEDGLPALVAKVIEEKLKTTGNCDAGVDAKHLVFEVVKEIDDTMHQQLGIRFNVTAVEKARRRFK